MADVPDSQGCPQCAADARRSITAPALGTGSTTAMRLLDATNRSASDPAVVSGPLPGGKRVPGTPVTSNPLHRKLPRP